jgi:hypothetical protein
MNRWRWLKMSPHLHGTGDKWLQRHSKAYAVEDAGNERDVWRGV